MISKTQKKFLRRLAHHKDVVIWIGQKGLTDNVAKEIESALSHHELIKLKIRSGDHQFQHTLIDQICLEYHAELIQMIGNVVSIFRQNQDNPQITLPR
jgi:RNA-binding protein